MIRTEAQNRKRQSKQVYNANYNSRRLDGDERIQRAKKHNDASRGRSRQGMPWTEQEVAYIWKTDFTTWAIAYILDRSIASVMAARRRFASKMPAGYVHNGNRKEIFGDQEVRSICETGPCGGAPQCEKCENET